MSGRQEKANRVISIQSRRRIQAFAYECQTLQDQLDAQARARVRRGKQIAAVGGLFFLALVVLAWVLG